MSNLESILFWFAVLMLTATFFLTTLALIFRKAAPQRLAAKMFAGALLPLAALGTARWVRTGHPPFVSLFESMVFAIFLLVAFYIIYCWRRPGVSIAAAPVSGIALLLMGWSLTLPHEASPLSAALDNVWLFIHASFATAGAAIFLIAAALALAYLLGPEKLARLRLPKAVDPEMDALPGRIVSFMLLGFIMWGTMIASGAIWAHIAWGRYWGWDPIELWSLISWIFYALLMHSRITFRIPVRLFCILTIFTAFIVAFSLWGIQYVYETIHTYG